MNKITALTLGTFLLGLTGAAQALSIPIGELINNGGFTDTALTGWSPSGAAERRLSTNDINTSAGNAGFNGFFASAFAALGDNGGVIGGTPNEGIGSISQSLTLPALQSGLPVASYDLVISFRTVFDGNDSSNANKDVFAATLNNITLFSQTSDPLPDCSPSTACDNLQLVNDPFSATIFGLLPGVYTLTFALNEFTGAATNTAAGIDNVSITGRANIPEPSVLLLFGTGLLAGLRRLTQTALK